MDGAADRDLLDAGDLAFCRLVAMALSVKDKRQKTVAGQPGKRCMAMPRVAVSQG
jgi:hypothetical protein